jgi:thioredoxin 1
MEITGEELKTKIGNGEKVVVDFWAKFCSPCRMMKPTFEKVGEEYKSKNSEVQLYTMDVEDNSEFARSLGIRGIPTIKTFNNGVETYSISGLLQEDQIKNIVENLLNG